ncbi:MAG TPA: peptidoglycan DD-metalloendopeptidase family protein [Stellaceae bacterium]|nr:peptidoglycan DD-metalloendopeptidase family protein [Stellaceae bacterium]
MAIIAIGFSAMGYMHHLRNLADAQQTTSRVEAANMDLQDELAQLRDKVAASNRDLSAAQSRVVALTEEMHARAQAQVAPSAAEPAAKGDKAAQLSQQLHMAEAERATLAARLSKAEADLAQQQVKQSDLMNQIDQWQKKLEEMSSDRDRLKARVGELEKQSALRHAQPAVAAATPAPVATAAPAAVAAARPAPTEPPQRVAGVLNAPLPNAAQMVVSAPAAVASAAGAVMTAPVVVAHGAVDHIARVLASAGVDVGHLFADMGVNRDEGGPFIPAHGQMVDSLSPQKLAALQTLVKTLPVRVPIENYRVTSPFGERTDPFNGRAAFHPGIDLAAPYGEPVYAAAPGVVTFSGYRSDYGKIVEVDHGHGIVTRYSHLARCTVNVGERVATGTEVGLEGSTGRSTGPHLLYEIDVNGEPQDPEKFFELSRFVQAVPATERN